MLHRLSDKQENSGPLYSPHRRPCLTRRHASTRYLLSLFIGGSTITLESGVSFGITPNALSALILVLTNNTCASPPPYISALAAILPRPLKQQRIICKNSDAEPTGRYCGVQGKHAATRNAPDTSRRTNSRVYLTACPVDQWATAFLSGADNGFADHRP